MKKMFFLIVIALLPIVSYSQITGGGSGGGGGYTNDNNQSVTSDKKNAFAVQALKFGVGVDYERLISKYQGVAISVGILGMEIETKTHFKPRINSSSIGIGTGMYFFTGAWQTQLFFEYRAAKYFTCTAGGGISLYDGFIVPAYRLSAGVFFPF